MSEIDPMGPSRRADGPSRLAVVLALAVVALGGLLIFVGITQLGWTETTGVVIEVAEGDGRAIEFADWRERRWQLDGYHVVDADSAVGSTMRVRYARNDPEQATVTESGSMLADHIMFGSAVVLVGAVWLLQSMCRGRPAWQLGRRGSPRPSHRRRYR